tara:strand:+ start:1283 stop:1987 length:705 start_codon:yes stop_codon:yes gene_type:complete
MSLCKILVIIPARKGSKGLKNKNKLIFNGLPLVEHAFKISKDLEKIFNINTVVSSDDAEINSIAKDYFPDVRYKRSEYLSSDTTSMNDTIFDVINWASKRFSFDWILLMQPTSPQRTLGGIINFINHAINQDKSSCFASISPIEIKKYEIIEKDKNNNYKTLSRRENSPLRQQDHSLLYFEDGAGYMSSLDFVKENKEFINASKLKYFECHDFPIIDIDNKTDFLLAEKLYMEK